MTSMRTSTRIAFTLGLIGILIAGCQAPSLPTPATVEPSDWSTGAMATDAWVMAWIGTGRSHAADSVHLSWSSDGLHWSSVNGGNEIYQVGIGTGHIRDPFVFRRNDGTFVLLATDFTQSGLSTEAGSMYDQNYWNHPSSSIYVAESRDLITFSNGRLLPVTAGKGTGGTPRHAWAPKAFYDSVQKDYAIYWSGNDEVGFNRTYVSHTVDFVQLVMPSDPPVYFDPGYSQSGAVLVPGSGKNYVFYAPDSFSAGSGIPDIQMATSLSLESGSFVRTSADYLPRGTNQGLAIGTRSPLVLRSPLGFWLMVALSTSPTGAPGVWSTHDLNSTQSWVALDPTAYALPATDSSSVVRVTQAELNVLNAALP